MPSAMEIYEAGIHFRVSDTDSLLDVHFERGKLSMPAIRVDDRTEKKFLNLMAFERLHPGAGNDVTAYVLFMDNIISSAKRRGAAEIQKHYRVWAGQRRGGGHATQQHAQQRRSDEPG